jgi:2-polyprenyl-6-methoxyphenol hydroxylase-like FAD-dependent oxidoreductase
MKAIVCGAGIAGLTVARELANAGWEITLLEASRGRREEGYMIDFFGPGFDAAEAIGLLPRLRELAYDIGKVNFVDETGRARSVDYDLVAAAQGGKFLSLMRPDLELALFDSMPDSVTTRFGAVVMGFGEDGAGVEVTTADGQHERGDILIGADGIHSRIRQSLFGDEYQFLRQLGFHTFAYIFDDTELFDRLGSSWLLTDSLNRMMGLYGLRDGRVAAFGTHRVEPPDVPIDTRAEVRKAYAGLGELTDRALERCPEPSNLYYDQVAQVELPKWSSERVVLVGDACQAVSLLAGQGASLAVAGGKLLAEHIVAAGTSGFGFSAYEAEWNPVVRSKQAAGRRAAASFVPTDRFALLVRRVAFRMLQWPITSRLVASRIIGGKRAAES